jgi:hypothetical protein
LIGSGVARVPRIAEVVGERVKPEANGFGFGGGA